LPTTPLLPPLVELGYPGCADESPACLGFRGGDESRSDDDTTSPALALPPTSHPPSLIVLLGSGLAAAPWIRRMVAIAACDDTWALAEGLLAKLRRLGTTSAPPPPTSNPPSLMARSKAARAARDAACDGFVDLPPALALLGLLAKLGRPVGATTSAPPPPPPSRPPSLMARLQVAPAACGGGDAASGFDACRAEPPVAPLPPPRRSWVTSELPVEAVTKEVAPATVPVVPSSAHGRYGFGSTRPSTAARWRRLSKLRDGFTFMLDLIPNFSRISW
jgi:hypothetical protein